MSIRICSRRYASICWSSRRLTARQTLHGFVCKQTEDRHHNWRHSSAAPAAAAAGIALSARTILHPIEDINQAHVSAPSKLEIFFGRYDPAVTRTWRTSGALARSPYFAWSRPCAEAILTKLLRRYRSKSSAPSDSTGGRKCHECFRKYNEQDFRPRFCSRRGRVTNVGARGTT